MAMSRERRVLSPKNETSQAKVDSPLSHDLSFLIVAVIFGSTLTLVNAIRMLPLSDDRGLPVAVLLEIFGPLIRCTGPLIIVGYLWTIAGRITRHGNNWWGFDRLLPGQESHPHDHHGNKQYKIRQTTDN